MAKRKFINRFNHLTSKEWLPFQKSWFHYEDDAALYHSNIRFFTKVGEISGGVYYQGIGEQLFHNLLAKEKLKPGRGTDELQFALLDLRNTEIEIRTVLKTCYKLFQRLQNRRFLTVFLDNTTWIDGLPIAWKVAKELDKTYSLKDEKMACLDGDSGRTIFYCLYFRKDENSAGLKPKFEYNFRKTKPKVHKIPAWYILKPPPRSKDEILHPAKYPEELVEMCLQEFTKERDNIFDPMSGTGSTQLAAMQMNRNGYGTELSPFFARIANRRCAALKDQPELFNAQKNLGKYSILNKDARKVSKKDFPPLDYIITSPPYWDMLNMKGAENQAKRIKKGLQTNYSDDQNDLGNIENYYDFLDDLVGIYQNNIKLLKPGGHLTVVVKNIKKKGRNYPFAWDLTERLSEYLEVLPETFWCQDDIRIAPYGYGNTWVSNTFHHYCLHFRKSGI